MIKLSEIMREYGETVRGDWSTIDGRDVRDDLENMSYILEERGNASLSQEEAIALRHELYICPAGKQHWQSYCDERCVIDNKED